MQTIRNSPGFWFMQGFLWSLVALLFSVEKSLQSLWAVIPIGIWAISCYVVGTVLVKKQKKQKVFLQSSKEDGDEKSN